MNNPILASCEILKNNDVLIVKTMSQGMMSFVDPDAAPVVMPTTSSDVQVGAAVLRSLAMSRRVDARAFAKILAEKSSEDAYDRLMELAVEKAGCESRTALFKGMKCVSITVTGGQMELLPMVRRGKSENFIATTSTPARSYLSVDATPAAVGYALRAALAA